MDRRRDRIVRTGLAAGTAVGWALVRRFGSEWPGAPAAGVALALLLVCGCPATLATWWLSVAIERGAHARATKREARRATLLRHADPVAAEVADLTARVDGGFTALFAAIDRAYTDAGLAPRQTAVPRLTIVENGRSGA